MTDTTTEIIDPPDQNNELVRIAAGCGLPEQRTRELLAPLMPLVADAAAMMKVSADIKVTDATQVSEIRRARAARLALKEIRCKAENVGKDLKSDALKIGQTVDAGRKWFRDKIEPEEKRLEECEKFAERAEAARKAELKSRRDAQLRELEVDPTHYMLGEMSEEAFIQLRDSSRAAYAARKHNQELEAQRVKAAEAQAAAEAERIRAENERLRQQAEAERQARQAGETAARLQREEEQRKAALLLDEARKKAEDERLARLKLERDAKAKADAEARLKAQRQAEQRQLAAAPDVEKLRAFALAVVAVEMPQLADGEASAAVADLRDRFAADVEAVAAGMER